MTETLVVDRELAEGRLRGVHWEGAAAEAFRQQSAHDFALYDHASGSLVDAARALEHLALTLAERQQGLIDLAAGVGRTVEDVWSEGLSGARHVLHDLTGGLL